MNCPLGLGEEIAKFKALIGFCSAKPEMLNTPQLDFLKEFVEQLGGKVPPGEFKMPFVDEKTETTTPEPVPAREPSPPSPPSPEVEDLDGAESDIELDMEGVIEPDKDEPQPMGDSCKEVTEEEMDEAGDIRSKAAGAYCEEKFAEAVDLYSKAIELNPANALFYAKRGQAFLKLKKPNACIRDCNRALELNCDSAAAYKFRGRANRLLGNWEQAANDLRQACKLDFDEEADEWLREVTPNAKKLEQHKIKQERKKTENEILKRQERVRKAQEANKRAQEEEKERQAAGGGAPPRAGAGGGGMPNLGNLFGNLDQSELLGAFSDPEISAAMQDIMSNPGNITKYQSNPKIMNFFGKLGSAMGGAGGGMGAGGFPGFAGAGGPPPGAGGFPGFGAEPPHSATAGNKPKPDFTDDGLD